MSEEELEDIRATSEDLIGDAQQLAQIEGRKADPTTPDDELVELAVQSEELTAQMADKARVERELAETNASSS